MPQIEIIWILSAWISTFFGKIAFYVWLCYKITVMKFLGAVKVKDSTYVVSYFIGGSLYKIPVTVESTTRIVSRIYNEYGSNAMDRVAPYLGPSLDCHNLHLD